MQDYKRVEYIALSSMGKVEADPAQGIIENTDNNIARVTTHAYPVGSFLYDAKLAWLSDPARHFDVGH